MTNISGSKIGIDRSKNITSQKNNVQQLVDILQTDIASIDNNTRKTYEVFVTGGIDKNTVSSSIFQTVYDQDFTLSTSNAIFDITAGLLLEENELGLPIVGEQTFSYDSSRKLVVSDDYLMVREKVNIYKQFAQQLLGDSNSYFTTIFGESESNNSVKKIKSAIFINFKRLFTRDNIYKGSFGLRLFKNASILSNDKVNSITGQLDVNLTSDPLEVQQDNNVLIDIHDAQKLGYSVSPVCGEIATLQDSNLNNVGLIFYDKGIVVLDVESVFDTQQKLRGHIETYNTQGVTQLSGPWVFQDQFGKTVDGINENTSSLYYYNLYTNETDASTIASQNNTIFKEIQFYTNIERTESIILYSSDYDNSSSLSNEEILMPYYDSENVSNNTFYSSVETQQVGVSLFEGNIYPDLMLKCTIDDIIQHVCSTRFGRLEDTSISFRNETVINSSFIFCRAAPSQLNYSTNPTYKDSNGRIIAVNSSGQPFSFVTTIGLYDTTGSLVAVAKTSRPIEKNKETDLSVRIRLDY